MTGVYNHAWLTPYNMEYITQIEIDRSMNVHDKDTYIVRACMDMMLADMEAMYPQSGITGNLYTGQEKDTWETGYGN